MKTYNYGDPLPELPDTYRWDVSSDGESIAAFSWCTLSTHNGYHWENVAWISNENDAHGPYEVIFAPVGCSPGSIYSERLTVPTLTDAVALITTRALLGMV